MTRWNLYCSSVFREIGPNSSSGVENLVNNRSK
jgi:hypothetical protein